MNNLIFSVLLAGLAVFTQSAQGQPTTKIVGGETAERGEYPFIVSIQKGGRHVCGGMLIGSRWVLTAAHCTRGSMKIVYGIHHIDEKNRRNTVKVKKKFVHPKYDQEFNLDYDFALLRLRKKVKMPFAKLNDSILPEDQDIELVVAGWGRTAEGGLLAEELQHVRVPLVEQEDCNQAYDGKVTDSMICAGLPEGGKDSCQGDSGGPLMMNTEDGLNLVGVVSWGIGCARPGKYGVYSRVSKVRSWIRKITGH